ncbi:hypothetical protein L1987_08758 [Smallanthus sonchifolius]|uniref:Uncharacterized protein n=1 Tax=Smallanthus sonchifolius TaxID=185202 RepID=A0ACB9JL37_9ASTR|nr:hypothetical protein L1987_08758 [Smallanthus sonchifolius]
MLEAEVSKLRHQVLMHEAHQCPSTDSPSLVSVGTQTDAYMSTDATKKGEKVSMEEDEDSLDNWIQEQFVLQSSQYKPAFVQVHDLPAPDNEDEEISEDWQLVVRVVDEMLNDAEDREQTNASFSILPQAAVIIGQSTTPQIFKSSRKLEFDSILAWGYDGSVERFWIGWEFSGVEELNWNSLNALQVLELHLTDCINTSADLSAELAIGRFYDLMEDNLPRFQRFLQAAHRVAYPESSSAAERRLSPNNLAITRSSLLTEEEVMGLQRFLYAFLVKDSDVLGWVSTRLLDHAFFLSNGSALIINTGNILQLPTNFLHKIYLLKANICNVNSLESQAMIAIIKAHLEKEGRIDEEEDVSTSDADSNSDTPQVEATSAASGTRSSLRDQLKEIEDPEYQLDEESDHLLSIPQYANEAEAEIPTAQQSAVSVISEARAEASNVNKGKGIMTIEDEERLQKEKKEKEERRRKREEEELAEEMAQKQRHEDRKAAILLRQQTIQLYAKQLDEMKVKVLAGSQLEEDEQLARQLQEQFAKEEEEEAKKKRKEDVKFRITDSKLAKELREEWTEALISQGEDADYLEKLSNKEIYRAFMGQQGELARKKKDEEKEKAQQKSKKAIALNLRTHEERKKMTDFLKARGESGKRLGPMSFMNLQALYTTVKKEEEERLEKRPVKKQRTSAPETTSSLQTPSTNIPKPSTPPPKKGRTERRRSTYRSVDEVLQLPDSNLQRILELGEAHKPTNESGKHLMLAIRHYFNPSKDVVMNIKPLKSHSPFVSWSYNADLDEFTLIDVKKQQMRCSSKAIYKMPHKDIKTLSELPLNNPSKDQRGYEAYQQHSAQVAADRLISSGHPCLLLIGLPAATFTLCS